MKLNRVPACDVRNSAFDEVASGADELCRSSFFGKGNRSAAADFVDRDEDGGASRQAHFPTRPVDREKAEQELSLNIKKAMSLEEAAPKQKHVRSQFPSTPLIVLRLIPLLQSSSSTPGTTTVLRPSGVVCVSSQSSPTRSKPSRR